ncbi:MAG: DUF4105 domain-containing protein [Bacteroidaceae bacterium]|nr:DUF4105 domain-containing protein [Bacteroidaceae bacterium]
MKRIVFFLMMSASVLLAVAQSPSHTEVSVITCSPGDEVYSLYGHTAIRLRDEARGLDIAVNYGVFDFNTDHFAWKFVLGETDYMCMAVPWHFFIDEYRQRGSSVKAQVLNLTEEETDSLVRYLDWNLKPENCIYRYNYLTDNCTLRVMDCVERAIKGRIVYSWDTDRLTYRDIIHDYTNGSPWAQVGNDILLGCDVDTILSSRAKCFVPDYYSSALNGALIRDLVADTRPMVRRTETLLEASVPAGAQQDSFPVSPVIAVWGLFAVLCLIALIEYRTGYMLWPLDFVLLTAHGVAGAILLFVFLFSQHPALDTNWQVWLLNPLPLLAMPFVVRDAWKRQCCIWHYILAAMILSFLVFTPWIPQKYSVITIPLALALVTRPVSYIIRYGRNE